MNFPRAFAFRFAKPFCAAALSDQLWFLVGFAFVTAVYTERSEPASNFTRPAFVVAVRFVGALPVRRQAGSLRPAVLAFEFALGFCRGGGRL